VNPVGTPVLAAAAGRVVVAGTDLEDVYGLKPDFYGNLVVQELDEPFEGQPVYVLYGHLSEVLVAVGQHLDPGEVLGLVGMTGVAIGNHLHLESGRWLKRPSPFSGPRNPASGGGKSRPMPTKG